MDFTVFLPKTVFFIYKNGLRRQKLQRRNMMSHFLLCICFVVVLLFSGKWIWNNRNIIKLSKKCQGPPWWKLAVAGIKCMGEPARIHNLIMDLIIKYPEITCGWFGPNLMYGISSSELSKSVLNSPKSLDKSFLFDFLKPAFREGVFTASAATWKIHKKIISPAFSAKISNSFVEIFSNKSLELIEELKKFKDEEIFDLGHLLNNFTLNLFCETAIGLDGNQERNNLEIGIYIDRLTQIACMRMSNIFYHSNFIFNCTKISIEQKQLIKKLHHFTDKIIKKKREKFNKQKQEHSLREENTNQPKAFLEHLIEISENDKKMTDEEIFQEVATFIFGASDTLSITLGFILCMLGMYPDIQEEVYCEALNILGPDRVVNSEDFSQMKFLERVIKETLRLFPVAPFLGRQVTEDLVLNDKITLPAKSSVIICVLHIHRNPIYYKNPLQFNPDRFLPEEMDKHILPYSYIPFSRGPRQCIGQNYAMNAMKTIISMLIRKYKFFSEYKSIEEIKLKSSLVLRPTDGYKVSFKSR